MISIQILMLTLFTFRPFRAEARSYLPDSSIRRMVDRNKIFIHMVIAGPRNYDSLVPLMENFETIRDQKLKGDAAFVIAHYYLHVFDVENSLAYFTRAADIYKRLGEWGPYVNVMKDFCNASRIAGRTANIESILKDCLAISTRHNVGFYVLNPLQELMVHFAYTEGRYAEAIHYGKMFMDTLRKYEAMNVREDDFRYSKTVDARIVELELGHSYLMTGDFSNAAKYLSMPEAFFLSGSEYEKLSRLYRHKAFLAAKMREPDSVLTYLSKFDKNNIAFNKGRTTVLYKIPRLTRDLLILNEAYQESKKKVEDLTKQNYYTILILFLTAVLGGLAFWSQRKSRLDQTKINELLRRDFERSQELNDAKSKYFSILSHELRTPIFAITGLARLLNSPEGNSPQNIDAIINSGNHLLHLVNNVLQHNKLEASEHVQLDETDFELIQTLNEVLQTTSYLAGQKNIEVTFQNGLGEPQFLYGDKQKLSQILVNLISNSIRYSYRDGKIEVAVNLTHSDALTSTYHFSIRDYGVGIEAAQISGLFDYRRTTYTSKNEGGDHFKGMGIGLFVVGNFIGSMGGRVEVDSTPGQGSNFYFNLTFKRSKPVEVKQKVVQRAKKDVNVLVVDDIKINLIVTQKTLSLLGINCITATDSDPIIEIIKEKQIDLVLMDLNMPLIDGYTLSKKIRQEGLTLPILAHTAVIKDSIDVQGLEQAEMQGYLIKPYSSEELKEKLMQYLHLSFEAES